MAKRKSYLCSDCNHLWVPRRKYPTACPSCGSSSVRENKTSWLGLLWVACFAVGAFYYLDYQEANKVAPPKKDTQKIAFSELSPPKPPPPEVDPNVDLTLKKLPKKSSDSSHRLIKISASLENAAQLAQERYQSAGNLYTKFRFEESPEALVELQEALIQIATAKQLIIELGALDKFGDTTLTRLLTELAKNCHRRIFELESSGIEWPKGSKKQFEIEIVETTAPKILRPTVIDKSGYGGKETFHAKFKIENKGPKATLRNLVVIFIDSIGLEIGKQIIGATLKFNTDHTQSFSAKYTGKKAAEIKTFKVQFD